MWWRHARRGLSANEKPLEALVRECESFLAGRLAEEWAEEGRRVPAWAWISVLAHSSESRLASVRDDQISVLLTVEPVWNQAVSFLAGAVLAAADAAGCSLERIQRDVLVPLELELLTTKVFAPRELVDFVVGAVNEYRS